MEMPSFAVNEMIKSISCELSHVLV